MISYLVPQRCGRRLNSNMSGKQWCCGSNTHQKWADMKNPLYIKYKGFLFGSKMMLIIKKILLLSFAACVLILHVALTAQMAMSIKNQNSHMIMYNLLGIISTSTILVLSYNIFKNLSFLKE